MPGPSRETEKVATSNITEIMHNECKAFFSEIRSFEGMCTLQVKEGSTAKMHYISIKATILRRIRVTMKAANNSTIRS